MGSVHTFPEVSKITAARESRKEYVDVVCPKEGNGLPKILLGG
jgi:hypothetical protein